MRSEKFSVYAFAENSANGNVILVGRQCIDKIDENLFGTPSAEVCHKKKNLLFHL